MRNRSLRRFLAGVLALSLVVSDASFVRAAEPATDSEVIENAGYEDVSLSVTGGDLKAVVPEAAGLEEESLIKASEVDFKAEQGEGDSQITITDVVGSIKIGGGIEVAASQQSADLVWYQLDIQAAGSYKIASTEEAHMVVACDYGDGLDIYSDFVGMSSVFEVKEPSYKYYVGIAENLNTATLMLDEYHRISAINVVAEPYKTIYYEGIDNWFVWNGLEVEVTYEDESPSKTFKANSDEWTESGLWVCAYAEGAEQPCEGGYIEAGDYEIRVGSMEPDIQGSTTVKGVSTDSATAIELGVPYKGSANAFSDTGYDEDGQIQDIVTFGNRNIYSIELAAGENITAKILNDGWAWFEVFNPAMERVVEDSRDCVSFTAETEGKYIISVCSLADYTVEFSKTRTVVSVRPENLPSGKFIYKFEDPYVVSGDFTLTLVYEAEGDKEPEEVTYNAFSPEWDEAGIRLDFLDSEGEYVYRDEGEPFPLGEYKFHFEIPGYKGGLDIPFEVVELEPTITLSAGEGRYGLPKNAWDVECEDGHWEFHKEEPVWIGLNLEAGKTYSLAFENIENEDFYDNYYAELNLFNSDAEFITCVFGRGITFAPSETEMYYAKLFIQRDYNVVLSECDQITEIKEISPVRDTFYRGLEDISPFMAKYEITMGGRTLELIPGTELWYQLGVAENIENKELDEWGNPVDSYDEYGRKEGAYSYDISFVCTQKPTLFRYDVRVVDKSEIDKELSLETPVSGFYINTLPINDVDRFFLDSQWVKTYLEGGESYIIDVTGNTNLDIYDKDNNRLEIMSNGTEEGRSYTVAPADDGWYYISVFCSDEDVEISMRQPRAIASVEICNGPKSVFYRGVECENLDGIVLAITYADDAEGKPVIVNAFDDVWNELGIFHNIRNLNNEEDPYCLEVDELGIMPGRYEYELIIPGYSKTISFPFEIKNLDELTEAITVDKPMTFAPGESKVVKLSVSKDGTYRLYTKLAEDEFIDGDVGFMIIDPATADVIKDMWGWGNVSLRYKGCKDEAAYVRIENHSEQSVEIALEKVTAVATARVVQGIMQDKFYSWYPSPEGVRLELVLDDKNKTKVEVDVASEQAQYYGISTNITDSNGDFLNLEENGFTSCKAYINICVEDCGKEFCYEVDVINLNDIEEQLTLGERKELTPSYELGAPYNQHVVKVSLQEGSYRFTFDEGAYVTFVQYIHGDIWNPEDGNNVILSDVSKVFYITVDEYTELYMLCDYEEENAVIVEEYGELSGIRLDEENLPSRDIYYLGIDNVLPWNGKLVLEFADETTEVIDVREAYEYGINNYVLDEKLDWADYDDFVPGKYYFHEYAACNVPISMDIEFTLAEAPADIMHELAVGTETDSSIKEGTPVQIFEFTAPADGKYFFNITPEEDSFVPYLDVTFSDYEKFVDVIVYDNENQEDTEADASETANNIQGEVYLSKGVTVYLIIGGDNKDMTGNFKVEFASADKFKYTLKFSGNGATSGSVKDKKVYSDVYTELPNTAFKKKGYSFVGWSLVQNPGEEDILFYDYMFPDMIEGLKSGSVVKLYAQWEKDTYYVNLDLCDWGDAAYEGERFFEYQVDTPTIPLGKPSREGFEFKGWYLTNDYGDVTKTKVTKIEKGSAGDKNIVAVWKAIDYKITYNLNGGKNPSGTPTKYNVESGEEFWLPVPERKGYDFAGWYTNKNFDGDSVEFLNPYVDKAAKLYAKWELITYDINYIILGEFANEIINSNPDKYGVSKEVKLKSPAIKGYKFGGWYKSYDPETNTYSGKVTSIKKGSTGDINLFAKFTPIKYTIKYTTDGGAAEDESYKSITSYYVSDDDIDLPELSKKGYIFDGWFYDSKFTKPVEDGYVDLSEAAKNLTFYAKFSPIKYTIHFDGNGATSGEMADKVDVKYGKSVTLPSNKFKNTGKTFVGWNTEADGSGKTYKNKKSVKNLATEDGAVVTLYAMWK